MARQIDPSKLPGSHKTSPAIVRSRRQRKHRQRREELVSQRNDILFRTLLVLLVAVPLVAWQLFGRITPEFSLSLRVVATILFPAFVFLAAYGFWCARRAHLAVLEFEELHAGEEYEPDDRNTP